MKPLSSRAARFPWNPLSSFVIAFMLLCAVFVVTTVVDQPSTPAEAASINGSSSGWMLEANGGIVPFGGASDYGSMEGHPLAAPIVGLTGTIDGQGYWQVSSDGGVFSFGDALFFGSTGAILLAQPIVGMAATPDGEGYWLVAADGGVFAFGDASFYGSTGAIRLRQPIVGMAATPDGAGYWLVAADGGVFAFGDASFYGSTGGIHLAQPIVGMAATPDGAGYWLVAADGGIFAFGSAPFLGSAPGRATVGLIEQHNRRGYLVVHTDGTSQPFGGLLGVSGRPPSRTIIAVTAQTAPDATVVSYGPLAGENGLLYRSALPESPLVVLVHGGGWLGGSNVDPLVQSEARYLQLHGITVFSLNYRPGSSSSVIRNEVSQVALGTQFAISQARSWSIDPNRVSLLGGSAGGTLVASASGLLTQDNVSLLNIISLSGPSDFTGYVPWITSDIARVYMLGPMVSGALGCSSIFLCSVDQEVANSPVSQSLDERTRWIIAGSSGDLLVPSNQIDSLTQHIIFNRGLAQEFLFPQTGHAFQLGPAINNCLTTAIYGGNC